jgi:hypothetical protein
VHTSLDEWYPVFSQDGRWIAFASSHAMNNDSWDLYRMDAEGGSVQQLTYTWRDDNFPAWSPIIDMAWRGWAAIGVGCVLLMTGYSASKKGRV